MYELKSGVAVLELAMPPEDAETCLDAARAMYASVEARRAYPPATAAERELRVSIDLWGGMRLFDLIAFCRDNRIVDGIALIAGALSLAAGKIAWEHSFVRRLTPEKPAGVSWHCDAEAASTMLLPDWERYISLWVPLVPVGVDGSPSLEVIVGSNAVMRAETLTPKEHRDAAWVDQFGLDRLCPQLNPGGVAAFDQLTLHRTQQARVDRERITMEVRFIP